MTSDDPLIGKTVAGGRYHVVDVLGRGGMGTVYTALQRPVDRKVALKIIHRELAGNPDIVARFLEEMRLTATIEHPHTVRVYDFGDLDGQPFLTTELLAGRSLRDELQRQQRLAPERVAGITVQIARALRAAHAHGVVHRDLKPENIMLVDLDGDSDYVKVLDFGIARSLHRTTGFRTGTGALLGTPAYMSPEQCEGKPVDARSDLYALGLIAYEMASGALPFPPSESMPQLLLAHVSQQPPDVRTRAPELGEALAALIMRLLAKSPDVRPPSADAVIAALEPLVPARRMSAVGSAATVATPAGAQPRADAAIDAREATRPSGLARTVASVGARSSELERAAASQAPVRPSTLSPQAPTPAPPPPRSRAPFVAGAIVLGLVAVGAYWSTHRHVEAAATAEDELRLGKLASQQGNDEAAEAHFRRAAGLDGHSVVARFDLAVVLLKRDRPADALPLLDSVLRDDPAHATAHLVRGQARLLSHDPRGAAEDLTAQTQAAPTAAAWRLLAQARQQLGDAAGAREALEKATAGAR